MVVGNLGEGERAILGFKYDCGSESRSSAADNIHTYLSANYWSCVCTYDIREVTKLVLLACISCSPRFSRNQLMASGAESRQHSYQCFSLA